MIDLANLVLEYRPYHKMPEFWEAFDGYGEKWDSPYDGVRGQAWDRGLECAMRYCRLIGK